MRKPLCQNKEKNKKQPSPFQTLVTFLCIAYCLLHLRDRQVTDWDTEDDF